MTDYDKIEQVKSFLVDLLSKCGINAQVEFEDSITRGLVFNISTPDTYLLIGRQGQHLHALEILAHAFVAKKFSSDKPFYFSLDVDDYKLKREWQLKEAARETATQVKRTGKPIQLEPMPNYERRIVHAYLQEHSPDIITESRGRDPHR